MKQKTILFLALLNSLCLLAQKQQSSPYSFFGIGTSFLPKTVEESSMGGVGAAISDPIRLSMSNPATLSSLRFTNYSLGVLNNKATVSDTNVNQEGSTLTLSYLNLGIPLGKKGGISLGVKADTGVGYELTDSTNPDYVDVYEGSGGSNSFYIGGGYQVFKGFSLGIQTSFIFGNITHVITDKEENLFYDTRLQTELSVEGVMTKLGAHYETLVFSNKTLSFGITHELEHTIDIVEVNIFNPDGSNGLLTNAANTTFAVAYGKRSMWQSSLELSLSNPKSFERSATDYITNGASFGDYQRISFGGYYTPKFNSLTSYFQRVTYRAGVKYENTGLILGDTEVKDLGMSFGVSLPLGKGLTSLNLGVDYGVKGEISSTTVEEKYFNIRLGVSLGDKWFNKRKIN
ncbi:MAG: hypothetical protein ACPH2K_06740 [Flavicella sp.]